MLALLPNHLQKLHNLFSVGWFLASLFFGFFCESWEVYLLFFFVFFLLLLLLFFPQYLNLGFRFRASKIELRPPPEDFNTDWSKAVILELFVTVGPCGCLLQGFSFMFCPAVFLLHGSCLTMWSSRWGRMSLFVCVEVLRPSQPNGVMSSAVSLTSHTFTGQA